MTSCTCLTCKHWKRHSDPMIGACWVVDLPLIWRWRGQHETCTSDAYQFGEDRPAAKITHSKESPLVDSSGRINKTRVCAYYAAPFGEVVR